jgi:CRISPR-associated protein Cas1
MQQLRGKEGARVRRIYREHSARTGVAWNHRDYDRTDFASGDPINQALSAAHACLYGIVHAVIVALGAAPGLGFVHTGHERAFVYDIADLYKAEVTIPVAFDVAASGSTDISADTRRAVRDRVHDGAILARCVRDVRSLLLQRQPSGAIDDEDMDVVDSLGLWDDKGFDVPAGRNYADTDDVDF